MSDAVSLPVAQFGARAMEFRAALCRNCGWQGAWVDTHDRTNTTYADESARHAAATGHRLIADIKVTYSPGETVSLPAMSRKVRRPLGGRGV
jgi:hypothetical protein